VREEKRRRDPSAQPPKSSKAPAGGKASQQAAAPQPAVPGQPQQGSFVAHKEIKLTLLNKVRQGDRPVLLHLSLGTGVSAQGTSPIHVPVPAAWPAWVLTPPQHQTSSKLCTCLEGPRPDMLRSCKALPHAAQRAPSHGGKGHRTALEGQGFSQEEAHGSKEPLSSNNRYTATLCLA
jgi:hypothetical protein